LWLLLSKPLRLSLLGLLCLQLLQLLHTQLWLLWSKSLGLLLLGRSKYLRSLLWSLLNRNRSSILVNELAHDLAPSARDLDRVLPCLAEHTELARLNNPSRGRGLSRNQRDTSCESSSCS